MLRQTAPTSFLWWQKKKQRLTSQCMAARAFQAKSCRVGKKLTGISAMLVCFESQLDKAASMVQMLTMSILRLLMAL